MRHSSKEGRGPARAHPRRIARVEAAILIGGILLACVVGAYTTYSLATFNRDTPLAAATQEIELHVREAQHAVFEVLAGDTDVDPSAGIFDNLEHAGEDCEALVSGGVTDGGKDIAPLSAPGDRDSAAQLCRQIAEFRSLTAEVLRDPSTKGEGTTFDERYDEAFEEMMSGLESLSGSLQLAVTADAVRLGRWGTALAATVGLIAVGVALLVGRHRRLLAAKTRQMAGLASIVESSVDAIVGKSVVGVITSWNSGAERLYGYGQAEIIGRHVDVLVPPERREEEAAAMARVCRGEQVQRYETDRLRKDGSTVPVALTMSPIFDGDTVLAISAIGQDISELKAKDAALRAAREEALEAREEALQSSRLKSEFLSTMSHEIRTPMNGVIGLTSLLLETPLNDTQRQYAEGVAGSGEALLTVINDILDFSKLEAGKVELELADFDPRRLVEEVASLLAVEAHSKDLELVAYCHPEVPKLLVGDGGRLRQILLNLVSNAVKFTAAGEVAISARAIRNAAGTALIRFQVVDTGIGLAAEAIPRMFDSFSQADASTTRRYGGTGLGLAISRKLSQAMGGEIGVDSDLGTGSTFWFQVPLPVSDRSPVTIDPPAHDALKGLPVLVVDDNATNRLVLESQLAAWGMRPDAIEYPKSVLAHMRAAVTEGHPYAIAVLDMCMPDMDGLELAGLISSDPVLACTRLILLTSTMEVDGADLEQAGVEQWMTKPVRSSDLYDRLLRLVAAPTVAAAAPQLARPRIASSSSRGRILVVEDNALNQLVAEGVVTKLGYQVDIVGNGVEALEAIAATYYAAVLMDCHMPVMDGFAATREQRVREDDEDRVPIIAMTAGAMAEDRERCLAAGMDDYVSKPVNVAAMRDALTRWVRPLPKPTIGPRTPEQNGGTSTAAELSSIDVSATRI